MVLRKIWRKIKYIGRRIISIYNARKTYDYPPCGEHWNKLGLINIEGFENVNVFDPYVLRDENGFVMYLSNRNNKNNIIRIESKDGKKWYNPIVALEPERDISWQSIINRVSVIKIKDMWVMYYTGQYNGKSNIGLATSRDGIHYTKRKDPVLTPSRSYEAKSIMNPCVYYDNGKYRMIYSAGQIYEPDVLCEAESDDGYSWNKLYRKPIFTKGIDEYDRAKVGGCNYLKIDNYEILFYIGYQNVNVARICFAVKNEDGEWIRYRGNPVLSPTKGDWDNNAVYKPSVLVDRDYLLLWYNGRNRLEEKIGFSRIELPLFIKQVQECLEVS